MERPRLLTVGLAASVHGFFLFKYGGVALVEATGTPPPSAKEDEQHDDDGHAGGRMTAGPVTASSLRPSSLRQSHPYFIDFIAHVRVHAQVSYRVELVARWLGMVAACGLPVVPALRKVLPAKTSSTTAAVTYPKYLPVFAPDSLAFFLYAYQALLRSLSIRHQKDFEAGLPASADANGGGSTQGPPPTHEGGFAIMPYVAMQVLDQLLRHTTDTFDTTEAYRAARSALLATIVPEWAPITNADAKLPSYVRGSKAAGLAGGSAAGGVAKLPIAADELLFRLVAGYHSTVWLFLRQRAEAVATGTWELSRKTATAASGPAHLAVPPPPGVLVSLAPSADLSAAPTSDDRAGSEGGGVAPLPSGSNALVGAYAARMAPWRTQVPMAVAAVQ